MEAALSEPKTDITRDASIQRFELCIELAWKTARKVMGSNSSAPRTVIREMASAGYIDDPDQWFVFLEARNQSSHTYREEVAEKVFATAQAFMPIGRALLEKLVS